MPHIPNLLLSPDSSFHRGGNCGSKKQWELRLGLQARCAFRHPQLPCSGQGRAERTIPLLAAAIARSSSIPSGRKASPPGLQGASLSHGSAKLMEAACWPFDLRGPCSLPGGLRDPSRFQASSLPNTLVGKVGSESNCLGLKSSFSTLKLCNLGHRVTLVCLFLHC